MTRYELSNLRRQAVLDAVVAYPGCTLRDLRERVVGTSSSEIGKILSRMTLRKEVAITGKTLLDGCYLYTYEALRDRCIPADECLQSATDKMLAAKGQKSRVDREENDGKRYGMITPGHYVHKPQSLPSMPGGQGGDYRPRMRSVMG